MAKLLILSTPRTGSNLLCECLTQTGVFGTVDGFFVGHGAAVPAVFDQRTAEYIANTQSPAGNFATKIMWDYIDELGSHLAYGKIDEFMQRFTHIVHLYREDEIAQAVSWYIALGCGKWTSKNEQKRDMPSYDYRRIAWHLGIIRSYKARTQAYKEFMDIPYMSMSYEYFADWESWVQPLKIQWGVQEIINFCGIDYKLPTTWAANPTLERQENPLKKEYIERFRKEWGWVQDYA